MWGSLWCNTVEVSYFLSGCCTFCGVIYRKEVCMFSLSPPHAWKGVFSLKGLSKWLTKVTNARMRTHVNKHIHSMCHLRTEEDTVTEHETLWQWGTQTYSCNHIWHYISCDPPGIFIFLSLVVQRFYVFVLCFLHWLHCSWLWFNEFTPLSFSFPPPAPCRLKPVWQLREQPAQKLVRSEWENWRDNRKRWRNTVTASLISA